MASIFQRGPDGKFLGYGCAIAVWLPYLMDSRVSGPVHRMLPWALDAMRRWCDHRAAECYMEAANSLTGARVSQEIAKRESANADRWFLRKAILENAAREISNI